MPLGYLPGFDVVAIGACDTLPSQVLFSLSLDEIRKPLQYPKMQPAAFMLDTVNIISTCLLQYLIIHHMIIKKLLVHRMSKTEQNRLTSHVRQVLHPGVTGCGAIMAMSPSTRKSSSKQILCIQTTTHSSVSISHVSPYLDLSVDSHT